MKRAIQKYIFLVIVFLLLFGTCATTERPVLQDGSTERPSELILQDALKNAVFDIKERIPQSYVLALVNFDTVSTDFSNYLIDELMSLLINETQLKIVERRQLETIQSELNFQMSGAVSEETAKSIGKFIGADTIITGTFFNVGNKYRLGIKSIHTETGFVQSLFISNVIIDRELSLIISSTNANQYSSSSLLVQQTGNNSTVSRSNATKINGSNAIISPDGKWIITSESYGGYYSRGIVRIYDILNGSLLRSFPVPPVSGLPWYSSGSLAMSNDGRMIAISIYSYNDSKIFLYDVITGRRIKDIKITGNGNNCLCQFNPIKNRLIAVNGNKVYLFDLSNGSKRTIRPLGNGIDIQTVTYSFDGRYIGIGSRNGTITVLDGDTLKILKTLRGHSESVNSLAFNLDNSLLISGSGDFTIGIWDLSNGSEVFTLTEHTENVGSVLFIPSGNYFLSGSGVTAILWDVSTFSVLKKYISIEKNSYLDKISLSPDGNYFITNNGRLYKIEY